MTNKYFDRELIAPIEYWLAKPDQLADTVNGCGSKTSAHVPDILLGLDITEACNIHDWMYTYNNNNRTKSDEIFLQNLLKLNKFSKSNKLIKLFRKPLLGLYYLGVRTFGSPHFKPTTEVILTSNTLTN